MTITRTIFFKVFIIVMILISNELTVQSQQLNNNNWIDSVYNNLTLKEKIGQLLLIRVSAYWDEKDLESVGNIIKEYNIGGIVLFKGNPSRQAYLINKLQEKSKTPMFVAIDGETGLSMRMDSTILFPRQMMLGAIKNDSLIYEFGEHLGVEAKRIGIHISFSPVADINNNALNPVIGNRSFGESIQNTTQKSIMMMSGMRAQKIISVAKHFPGHGDTETDSHHDLPLIKKSYLDLNKTELIPFIQLIKNNIPGIMVAHLYIPLLDTSTNRASSLSPIIVNGLLRDSLKYQGLVFTDGLDMRGVSKYFKPGEIELKALEAGNDVLILPQNPTKSITTIINAIDSGYLDSNIVNRSCYKIIKSKYGVGLNDFHSVKLENIVNDLNGEKANFLNYRLITNSITCIKNTNNFIPIKNISQKILCVGIGKDEKNFFQNILDLNLNCDYVNIPKYFNQDVFSNLLIKIKEYETVLIDITNTNNFANYNYGITNDAIILCDSIASLKPSVLVLFATPYILNNFKNLEQFKSVIVAYQDNKNIQELTAQTVLGVNPAIGVLPVTITSQHKYGNSIKTNTTSRIGYGFPEEFGISQDNFSNIDSLLKKSINDSLFSSASIGVIYKNKIIYNKNYGKPDYNDSTLTSETQLYDLSALTKIFSTTLAIMKLYDEDSIDLYESISTYLPMFENSNKENIIIKDLLLHQSGLADWLPFHKYFINKKDRTLNDTLFSKEFSSKTPIKVADGIFCSSEVNQIILEKIKESSLSTKRYLRYSNLGYYLLKEIVEKVSKTSIDTFVYENIYKPLALKNTLFNPLQKFSKENIVSTSNDTLFRNQILRGYVHDEGAALLGGVAGQAGLFSKLF